MPNNQPAAFGRLCVETTEYEAGFTLSGPAAFGRLCVETPEKEQTLCFACQLPSGGCVLKRLKKCFRSTHGASRLRAAVC